MVFSFIFKFPLLHVQTFQIKNFSSIIWYRQTSEIQQQTLNNSHLVGALKMNAGLLFLKKKNMQASFSPFLNENFPAAAKFPDICSQGWRVLPHVYSFLAKIRARKGWQVVMDFRYPLEAFMGRVYLCVCVRVCLCIHIHIRLEEGSHQNVFAME